MGYCFLSTEDLRRLSAEGDTEAQQWLIHRFREDNPDLPNPVGRSLIRFDYGDGHILMSLHISEDASLDDIRQNWHIIAEWRRRLNEWQGRWRGGMIWSSKAALYTYLDSRKPHMSYAALANWVNGILVNFLEYDVEVESSCAPVEALCILEWLGISNEDARQWVSAISEEIRAGREPFPPDGGPIDKGRMRDQLRYWREGGKNQPDFSIPKRLAN